MFVIEIEHLTKFYSRGKIKALEDVTLQIEAGKIFSLLGPNGAGKTTLIKILLGIVFPTRGQVRILNQPVSNYRIHSKIGYLAENHHFPEFLTANQVLYYYGKISGVSPEILKGKIPALLKLVNLENWGNVKIRKFSKGMLQRLGIAQALINDPEILFLDEPTDGIDPVGRREIRDLLMQLRDEGKSIFLNSHLLSEVERISDEAAILKNGRLLQTGSVQDFISVKEQYQIKIGGEENLFTGICWDMNVPVFSQNGHFVVKVNDSLQLNYLIDAIRQKQIAIEAIVPRKISLEDFFIDLVEAKTEANQ